MEVEDLFRLLNARSPWARLDSLENSEKISQKVALGAARACLGDSHSAVRRASADMIAKYGSSRDFYRLQLASIDTAWEVRSSVAGAFGSLRLARSAKRLAEMLRIDHHFIVRRDAAEALAVVNANAEGILRDCLVNEKDNIVQSSIYRALYMLGDRAVLSKILLYLNDDDSLVRTNVVNGLRFTGVDENDHELVIRALDALLLTETHPGVREDASVFRSELETFGAEYLPKDFVK